ncbi:hypothetical protein [Erythrobacter cryptus]|uniref:hypothetical protein n=1 Tax=Erythrobacter cryptus TaxID=196588 RepID=UPI000419BA3A|nr:hypothetical protein [Erythrobacter cryptus]GIX18416.1 MAG: hypothetical protein KatS3mg120_0092 [Erythrobacter sp.]
MKFIKLESRGGNYLVVAENVAWLRSAENGQTSVGIKGGQPLLVVGSIEEVAAKLLAGAAEGEAPAPAVTPDGAARTPAPAPTAEPLTTQPAPAPAPAPAPVAQPVVAPAAKAPPIAETPPVGPSDAAPSPPPSPGPGEPRPAPPARPRPARSHGMSLADRVARAAAPKVRQETQRFMGLAD